MGPALGSTAMIPSPRFNHRLPFPLHLAPFVVALLIVACSTGGTKPTAASQSSTAGPVSGASGTTSSVTVGTVGGTGAAATAAGPGTCRTGTTTAGGGQGGGDVLVPGDIPDGIAYVTYHSPDGFHIDHPDGWSQSEVRGAVVFTDKFNSIRIEVTPVASAPTVASARSGEVPTLAAAAPCYQAGVVTQVTRKSGPAVLITYRADSAQDPVTGKVVLEDVERYEFWSAGHQATITLSASRGSDNVDPWRRVTDSFAWGS